MGVAAYNRGSNCIRKSLAEDYPTQNTAFHIMDRWNALAKYSDAVKPFGDSELIVLFDHARNMWVLECTKTGFGYFYPGAEGIIELMKSWHILVIKYDQDINVWTAVST
jgi:hypothetical protein